MFQDKVFILITCVSICWCPALMMMMYKVGVADQEYLFLSENLSWDEARNHCQVCFKELVTLTPSNIQSIANKLVSDSWIGLRKNFHPNTNSTTHPNKSWTRWANGDPLFFQNWYPGWPVFKSTLPKINCCSCSCTCPAVKKYTSLKFTTSTPDVMNNSGSGAFTTDVMNISGSGAFTTEVTSVRSFTNATNQTESDASGPMETTAQCICSPVLLLDVPDPNEHYIEDSCVAMLSSGTWIEKNCSDILPFICYEDNFVCKANVTDITNNSATLTWPAGPGAISHYRVELRGPQVQTETTNNLTYDLSGLTPGGHYSVQVFPVKCQRDLNSQEVSFYTIPNKVENLTVSAVTEASVVLRWKKPAGFADSYIIKHQGGESSSLKEEKEVSELRPGNPYAFTVLAKVNSLLSEASNITAHTKPSTVTDLRVSEIKETSLLLNWKLPRGNATAFRVLAMNDSNVTLFGQNMTHNAQTLQSVKVTPLPEGTKITLTVAALAGDTVGDNVITYNYTAPGPISDLELETNSCSLSANWSRSQTNYFTVELQLYGIKDQVLTVHGPKVTFEGLKSAANYTVVVYSNLNGILSSGVARFKFTKPSPPTDLIVKERSENQLSFQWKAPQNTVTAKYLVKFSSSFWNYEREVPLDNQTSCVFTNLKSGTKYNFQVQTVTDDARSIPLNTSNSTIPVKAEVSLAMQCSSPQPLLCVDDNSRKTILAKLQERFQNKLKDDVFWELEMKESDYTVR